MTDFSNRLKTAMKTAKVSQKELAKRIGTTEVTISRYIHGTREPKIGTIQTIAEQLGISVSELIANEETEQEEIYSLTPYACLMEVLNDYGIDTSGITQKIGEHMVDDFFELMERQGILRKGKE